MQNTILSKLSKLINFSPNLLDVLIEIKQNIDKFNSSSNIKKIQSTLVGFTCQNKNLVNYKYFEQKSMNEKCLNQIFLILLGFINSKKQSMQRILDLFFVHIQDHSYCFISFSILYKLICYSRQVFKHMKKHYFNKLISLIDRINLYFNNCKQLKYIHQFRRDRSPKNIFQTLDNQLSSVKKPKHLRQTQNIQKASKIPPLVLPTSKSINSSRYSLISKDQKKKGLEELQKLSMSLGQAAIGVQLGCLLSKKRLKQVKHFSQFEQYKNSQSQKVETQRDLTSRAFSQPQNQSMNLINTQQSDQIKNKYHSKIIIIIANILYKFVSEDFQEDQYFWSDGWFSKIFDLLYAGIIKNYNIEKFKHKSKSQNLGLKMNQILLPKQIIFSKLFNMFSRYSQNLHLTISLLKNILANNTTFETNSDKSNIIQITDTMLGKIMIQKKKINKKLLTKLAINSLDKQSIQNIKESSNKFIIFWKTNFVKILGNYQLNKTKCYGLQINLLNIMSNYLKHSQSKITSYELIDNIFDILIGVKRQIMQLSMPFLKNKNEIEIKSQNSLKRQTNKFIKKNKIDFVPEKCLRPLIFEYKQFLGVYLSVISGILVSNKYVQKLFNNIFVKCQQFLQLIQAYLTELFTNIETQNYDSILKVLNFYKKFINIYFIRKQRNQDSKPIKILFESIYYLFNLKNGLITNYLKNHESLISVILQQKQIIQAQQTLRFNFIRQLLKFVQQIYNYPSEINILLEEDIGSFYLKYSFLNFVKLYSFLTVTELVHIKQKIQNADYKFSPQNHPTNSNTYYNQTFMISFLQILINISINRTEQISKKIRQYRILQFFVRELELEFSLRDYRDRYRKIKTQTKTTSDMKESPVIQKNSKISKLAIPSLSLNNDVFKKKSEQQRLIDNQENKPTKKGIPPLRIPDKHSLNKKQVDVSQQKNRTVEFKKTDEGDYLDELLYQITKTQQNEKSPPKSFVPNLKLSKLKTNPDKNNDKNNTKEDINLTLNLNSLQKSKQDAKIDDDRFIYLSQRKIRKIYSNRTIHSNSILLILSLILKKGLLDPTYCEQYPIIQGKINVLYILHHHLNHQANYSILSNLTQGVTRIKPYPSGQRLLKLLASPFTNMSVYLQWTKINSGAYGIIYSCKTNLASPQQVAIKQMNFPKSIYQRCVLNDIFTEITCLENFRLDPKVTDLYDFGVTQNTYVIIMKKYPCSLRDWRLKQKQMNIGLLLNIFRQILKVVQLLHDHNVTHYDIKADNILIDYKNIQNIQENKFTIVFGDFGECKIYQSQKQQLDLRSRGTQCIKSPEMLTLAIKSKKQAQNYDRRKKIGTTKSSDIWSLGCLFYELMTGQFLFHRPDWVKFYVQVTSPNEQIINEENMKKLNNNIYLIDFLKYILIRDPQHRPSIESIMKRFQNIHGLLVSNGNPGVYTKIPSPLKFNQTLETLIEDYVNQIVVVRKIPKQLQKSHKCLGLLKIMEDIYFCEQKYFNQNKLHIIKQGVTHVISNSHSNKFFSLVIKLNTESINTIPFRLVPRVSDFLREVLIFKGKLLFVNNQSNYAVGLLIFCLSLWFRCTIYQTWCLINTQILQFPFSSLYLPSLSNALFKLNKIEQHIQNLPKLQCICGSVTFILKRNFAESNKGDVRICKCKKKRTSDNSDCPSPGCANYLQFLKKRFNIEWDHLKWNLINVSNFLIGPLKCGKIKDSMRIQIVINSADPNQNLTEVQANNKSDWRIYKCKICEMWMLSQNQQKKIWIVMNNLIKTIRQGIMIPNAQQNFKIRTPVLNNFTLSKLHMISQ